MMSFRFAIALCIGLPVWAGPMNPPTAKAQTKPAAAAAAKAAPELVIVVRLAEPANVSDKFAFDKSKSQVRLLSGQSALKTYFNTRNCPPGKDGTPRCHVIDTIRRDPAKRCLAVLLDSDNEIVSLKDFKIGIGKTEDHAIRDAFIGSNVYDRLYSAKRVIYLLAPPQMIDEQIFNKETEWLSGLLGSGCPGASANAPTKMQEASAKPATFEKSNTQKKGATATQSAVSAKTLASVKVSMPEKTKGSSKVHFPKKSSPREALHLTIQFAETVWTATPGDAPGDDVLPAETGVSIWTAAPGDDLPSDASQILGQKKSGVRKGDLGG